MSRGCVSVGAADGQSPQFPSFRSIPTFRVFSDREVKPENSNHTAACGCRNNK
jgi:hypothetical protein